MELRHQRTWQNHLQTTEIYKTADESVSVQQGQLLRAIEKDQGVLKVRTQRQRVILEFTHSLLSSWCTACVYGKAADDLHRRRRDSDLEDTLSERTENAAVTEPEDVTEYMVRVSCDRLDEWSLVRAVSSVKMRQQRSHCRTLLIRRDE